MLLIVRTDVLSEEVGDANHGQKGANLDGVKQYLKILHCEELCFLLLFNFLTST